jgi:hypothetical protein
MRITCMYKKNRTQVQKKKKRKDPSPAGTFNEERGFLFLWATSHKFITKSNSIKTLPHI